MIMMKRLLPLMLAGAMLVGQWPAALADEFEIVSVVQDGIVETVVEPVDEPSSGSQETETTLPDVVEVADKPASTPAEVITVEPSTGSGTSSDTSGEDDVKTGSGEGAASGETVSGTEAATGAETPSSQPGTGTASISGTVVDADGQPLADVAIMLHKNGELIAEATSTASGAWQVRNLAVGAEYYLSFHKEGYTFVVGAPSVSVSESGQAAGNTVVGYKTGEEMPEEQAEAGVVIEAEKLPDEAREIASGILLTVEPTITFTQEEIESFNRVVADIDFASAQVEMDMAEGDLVAEIVLSVESNTVAYGEDGSEGITVTATLTPGDTGATIEWTVDDESASIEDSGESVLVTYSGERTEEKTVKVTATVEDTDAKSDSIMLTFEGPEEEEEPAVVPAASISIDQGDAVTVAAGDSTVPLTATVLPENATDRTVVWTSSNESVATVSDGLVTFAGANRETEQSVTITAKANSNTDLTDSVTVTFAAVEEEPNVAATGISIAGDETVTVAADKDAVQLSATVEPEEATDKTVVWVSSNESVATVSDGLVTFAGENRETEQSVIITAKANGDNALTDSVTVIFAAEEEEPEDPAIIKTIALGTPGNATEFAWDAEVAVTATITPTTATEGITWSVVSGNAEVDNDGVVKSESTDGTEAVEVEVKAAAEDHAETVFDTITITFLAKPQDVLVTAITVTSDLTDDKVIPGVTTAQLAAQTTPENPTTPGVTWSTETSGATVSETGLVTYSDKRTEDVSVTVRATAKDTSGEYDEITLTFMDEDATYPITGIDLSAANTTLAADVTEAQVTATLTPAYTKENVKWALNVTSEVATIDQTGKVTLANDVDRTSDIGVIVTAKNQSEEITENLSLTFIKEGGTIPVTSIALSSAEGTTIASTATTAQVTAVVSPSNATNQTVDWSIDAAALTAGVTISDTGLVTYTGERTEAVEVTVTATAKDETDPVSNTIVLTFAAEGAAEPDVPVTGITLASSFADNTVPHGQKTTQITATIAPTDATDKTLTWAVNTTSATITQNEAGALLSYNAAITEDVDVTVTATAANGVKGTLPVTFKAEEEEETPNPTDPVLVKGVALSGMAQILPAVSSVKITATVYPADATNKTLDWKLEPEAAGTLTVDQENLTCTITFPDNRTGLSTMTLTATAKDGSEKSGTFNLKFETSSSGSNSSGSSSNNNTIWGSYLWTTASTTTASSSTSKSGSSSSGTAAGTLTGEDSANPPVGMYLLQSKENSSVVSSVMLVRNLLRLQGVGFTSVTEASFGTTDQLVMPERLMVSAGGNTVEVTIDNDIGTYETASEREKYLADLLGVHPEGMVVYSGEHAVFLHGYENGTFYVADPAASTLERVALADSKLMDGATSQDDLLMGIENIWRIACTHTTYPCVVN